MFYHPLYNIFYEGRGDPYVFTEQKRDYGRLAHRAKGAIVLDFGGHCGFFNVYLTRNHTPRQIITVEPDPKLLPCLRKNCSMGTEIIQAAVVDRTYPDKTAKLFLGKTFAATNSLEPFRGRDTVDVPIVYFQTLLARGVQFVKCDCEGGEYGLNWRKLPLSVHSIAIEFHFHRPHWEGEMINIDKDLLRQGFTHVKAPKYNSFQKISTGLYQR